MNFYAISFLIGFVFGVGSPHVVFKILVGLPLTIIIWLFLLTFVWPAFMFMAQLVADDVQDNRRAWGHLRLLIKQLYLGAGTWLFDRETTEILQEIHEHNFYETNNTINYRIAVAVVKLECIGMLWGYSPAQDMLGVLMDTDAEKVNSGETVNVLLAGCSDPRHILMTLAKYYTHKVEVTIHFYVAEALIDFVARELLLLILALEPSDRVPLCQKTLLWMELFGNALIRPKSMEYLLEKSEQLIHLITDTEFNHFRLPCVDLTDLKYKERDNLETCFRYWTRNEFNMSQHWDARLRKKLGPRYDSRNGVFEWDYFMKMKDKHKPLLVNSNEYNQWRKNGVAFVWLETEYCMSNATFAMGVHAMGDQLTDSGYFGDMDIGPYYTFATDCEDAEMLKKNHHTNLHRATDIFGRNLTRCFYEIENQKTYVHKGEDERTLGQIILKVSELDMNPKPRLEADTPKVKETYSSIPLKHKIHFLNTKSIFNLPGKSKFKKFFDVVFVAQSMEKMLMNSDHHKDFFGMMDDGAVVVWETRKAYLNINKEGLESFEDAVKSMMQGNSCQPIGSHSFNEDFMVKYKVVRPAETS